jgi:hypothetical protein
MICSALMAPASECPRRPERVTAGESCAAADYLWSSDAARPCRPSIFGAHRSMSQRGLHVPVESESLTLGSHTITVKATDSDTPVRGRGSTIRRTKAEYYEQRYRQQQIDLIQKKAGKLGLQITEAHGCQKTTISEQL